MFKRTRVNSCSQVFFSEFVSWRNPNHTRADIEINKQSFTIKIIFFVLPCGVAQWIRISLLIQRTWVWPLVWEDPTCHRATKPVRHNYSAFISQLPSLHAATSATCAPRAYAPQEKPPQWEPTLHNKESPPLMATRGGLRKPAQTQCSQN